MKSAQCVGDRSVFFFVSGGVDSTVAYTLCLRALGAGRVDGVYVDTGLMREGETDRPCISIPGHRQSNMPKSSSSPPLAGVRDPEQKRHIIGEEFVRVQERILESRHLLDGQLDSRPGHHLSRYHRVRRHRKSRGHQDPPQPRRPAFRS